MNIQKAKKVAKEHGYEFWYDRFTRLWTIQKGEATEYVSPQVLKDLTEEEFINYLKSVKEYHGGEY